MSGLQPDAPAFARAAAWGSSTNVSKSQDGLTARQHAAIILGVPDSGVAWLDAMIRRKQRDDLAARAMQGIMADSEAEGSWSEIAYRAYSIADAMLKAGAEP